MKNILVFGATGYLGRSFCEKYSSVYNIVSFSRDQFDFLNPDYKNLDSMIEDSLPAGINGIIFLQGLNPSTGVDDITQAQFENMLAVNLITPLGVVRACSHKLEKDASVVFVSSIAQRKGSYDPSYATAKSGLIGLQQTLSNKFPNVRFNIISLGLVENSPVHQAMTPNFEKKHLRAMNGHLVDGNDVCKTIEFLIECKSIARTTVAIDRGYKI